MRAIVPRRTLPAHKERGGGQSQVHALPARRQCKIKGGLDCCRCHCAVACLVGMVGTAGTEGDYAACAGNKGFNIAELAYGFGCQVPQGLWQNGSAAQLRAVSET